MQSRPWLALGLWLLIMSLLLAVLAVALVNATAGTSDAISLLALVAFGTVGPLIVARRPDHVIGWLICLDVLVNAIANLAGNIVQYAQVTQPQPLPGVEWLAWLASWLTDIGWALLFTFTFLLFPDGRLPSRRWRPVAWFIAAILVYHTLVSMFRPGPFEAWPSLTNPVGLPLPAAFIRLDEWLNDFVVLVVIVCVGSVAWRFRTAQGEARQQIKWMGYVATLIVSFIAIQTLTGLGEGGSPADALYNILIELLIAAFPVAVGVSILRYRLWDIDVLIRRTLIYGALTAALALLYLGSTLLLQQFFRAVTREDSQLVVVLSTLGIAAASAPLRRRIQAAIDRRFYRRTVDAAQTLAAFSAAARDEVDLDRLTQALLDSVGASFQPEHSSVTLLRPARRS